MARAVRILAQLHSRRRFRRRLFLCGGRSDYSASFCPSAGIGLGCSIIDGRRAPPTRTKFPASGCGHTHWSLLKALARVSDDVVDLVNPYPSGEAVSDGPSSKRFFRRLAPFDLAHNLACPCGVDGGWDDSGDLVAPLRAGAHLGNCLSRLADHKKPARPGPNSKTDDDFLLTLECLNDTKGKEREGRELFVKRVKVKDSIEAASASKRFTAAMKRVRALKLTFFERG
jgi:hypothetical protein